MAPAMHSFAAMRVLVTWGSKRGGTAGIGQMLAAALETHGINVVAAPAAEVHAVAGFDAAIVGGALYANRWHASARRFINHNAQSLRKIPTWLFSSGPLDDSADQTVIPPTRQVAVLAERVGARGHVTFGGRLTPDAQGFPASAMAKKHSGDWRNPDRIRAWAAELADSLPAAKPGTAIDHPARSVGRLVAYGVAGWALCAATMGSLLRFADLTAALIAHAVAAPVIFLALARHYFRARGARDPLPTAIAWTAIVVLLDAVIMAGAVLRSLKIFGSVAGTWLPFAMIFVAIWATGALMSTMPWPTKNSEPSAPVPRRPAEGHERSDAYLTRARHSKLRRT
jgi:menaquinone-dependent protoporphyrinogen oxidase